jgi:hypothetical protein
MMDTPGEYDSYEFSAVMVDPSSSRTTAIVFDPRFDTLISPTSIKTSRRILFLCPRNPNNIDTRSFVSKDG